jgi:dTDP-4-dehydrorhamnose 3,5-epimerase
VRATPLRLPEVVLCEPAIYRDDRGYFLETFRAARYEAAGIAAAFVQDNVSVSRRGVLRGLHYQEPQAQGKLVTALVGEIFDVAVDIRRGSPTFGEWVSAVLTEAKHEQLWIPPGFAHGFCVTSETAVVAYKCTTVYEPAAEGTIVFSDPALGIAWPVPEPIVSPKDRAGLLLADVPAARLPVWR